MSEQPPATQSTQERFKRGATDANRFFTYIADFVGFTAEDAAAIKDARFVIEKYIPRIVGEFYAQLLRFPATRKHFLKPDSTIDQEYLEMRMQHQVGFWRRVAHANFDQDFTRFVDYVGRAHTSKGADPSVYIPQRYVIGMVGFVQHHIADALSTELREVDPDLERRATKALDALMMVLLEMFSRPYVEEGDTPSDEQRPNVDDDEMQQLAKFTYERDLGIARSITYHDVLVGNVSEIAEGERRIIDVDGLSVGVFHHRNAWIALHNSCLHRGGPVCTGELDDDTLTCPWHGYQYDVRTGQLLLDGESHLESYAVDVRDGQVFVKIPTFVRDTIEVDLNHTHALAKKVVGMVQTHALSEGEFYLNELQPGQVRRIMLNGKPVALYNIEGKFYATSDICTHAGGPLSEGRLESMNIVCPWHNSCFDVSTGAVTCRPAKKPVQVYRVVVADGVGRVEQ